MKLLRAMIGISLLLVLSSTISSWAQQVEKLTFDELPFQPVDGLSFMGVTFDFKINGVDSTDANYNSGGPGTIIFVQDPSLEGNAEGILTLDFDAPTLLLRFGFALSTGAPVPEAVRVVIFDPQLTPVKEVTLRAIPLVSFAENRFFLKPGEEIQVKRVEIDFNQAFAARFALDNLTYITGGANPAPSADVSKPSVTKQGHSLWTKTRSAQHSSASENIATTWGHMKSKY